MKLLNEIQQKLKVPKGQYNSFSKFYYRNAEDILEAVKPLLGDSTLILSDEVVAVGNRNYVKATATLYAPGGDDKQACAWAVGWACESEEKKGMDAAQITGAASSYARKYALNGLFCIDDTKDADTEAPEAPKQALGATKPAYPPMTPKNDAKPLSEPSKEEKERIKAAKDRIIRNLKVLGHPVTTREEIAAAISFELDVDLSEAKDLASMEAIAEQLAEKASKKK